MYTSEKRDEILNSFDEGVSDIVENGHPVLDTNPVDLLEDLDAINDYIKDNLNHAVFSKIPEGSPAPNHLIRVSVSELPESGDAKLALSVIIRNSVNSLVPFKYEYRKVSTQITAQGLIEFIASALHSILHSSMAAVNLGEVNDFFAEAVSADNANLDYTIQFIPRSAAKHRSNFVDQIDNDSIVLVADEDRAFEVPNLVVFSEIDEDDEFAEEKAKRRETSRANVFEKLVGLDRPVDFLGAKLKLVKVLTSLSNHSVATLVSKSYSRKVTKSIEGVRKDLDILVRVDKDVIGAVRRTGETGDFEVILNPFQKGTLEPSDVDLVAEVKKQLAAA